MSDEETSISGCNIEHVSIESFMYLMQLNLEHQIGWRTSREWLEQIHQPNEDGKQLMEVLFEEAFSNIRRGIEGFQIMERIQALHSKLSPKSQRDTQGVVNEVTMEILGDVMTCLLNGSMMTMFLKAGAESVSLRTQDLEMMRMRHDRKKEKNNGDPVSSG